MTNEISFTGYWNREIAHLNHVHSKELSEWICKFLANDKDKLVYDFGCGLGKYLKDLNDNGFTKLIGFEGDPPDKKEFDRIEQKDLTIPFELQEKGNVISLEVGEHIPREYQDIYIDNITNPCDGYLIASWAIRNQPGFGHVNCLNNNEIIPEFEKRGFEYLIKESMDARSIIAQNTCWFRDTLIVFKKLVG
jgi:SAM-dependent methyltransferase